MASLFSVSTKSRPLEPFEWVEQVALVDLFFCTSGESGEKKSFTDKRGSHLLYPGYRFEAFNKSCRNLSMVSSV